MRTLAAALFVIGGLIGLVTLGGALGVFEDRTPWLVGPVFAVATLGLVAAAQWLFNRKGVDPLGRPSLREQLQELEQRGLLESTEFDAVRAFGVEELEDEGLHYFLELGDGRVLFLSGQYLYDYEPDPGRKRPRAFPCAKFTVRRHKHEGYVTDIRCAGSVLEPEVMAPPFETKDWNADRVPQDGQLITDKTYDELMRERGGEHTDA